MLEQNWSIIFASLIDWYSFYARKLPWRDDPDPYKIWLAEVIMQQTRIDQGLPYYYSFISKYPQLSDLALAEDNEVLGLWQGLGYYSRAHNLLKTARIIYREHNGIIPHNYNELISLPGIGSYTAAAIMSVAFNQPYACVDGNVKRLISRIMALDILVDAPAAISIIKSTLSLWINSFNPSEFNQALMEFGALCCTPSNPDCSNCPLNCHCYAYLSGNPTQFPVRKASVIKKHRYLNFFYLPQFDGDNIPRFFIVKRGMADIWSGLHEFPCIETIKESSGEQLMASKEFQAWFRHSKLSIALLSQKNHILTHQHIHASLYKLTIQSRLIDIPNDWILTDPSELNKYPVHRLMKHLYDYINS